LRPIRVSLAFTEPKQLLQNAESSVLEKATVGFAAVAGGFAYFF